MRTHKLLALYLVTALVPMNLLVASKPVPHYRIGLLIVATNKYTCFIPPLIESAEHFFLPNHDRTYFIFTNRIDQLPKKENIVPIYQEPLAWPFITMMRCEMYCKQRELLQSMDYLFATDADMRFVNLVGDEILSDLVATRHPGFIDGKRVGTFETNPQSTAYIGDKKRTTYFAGGFYGGSAEAFLTMNETMCKNIYQDLEHNIVAVWHDESHLNHYFLHHKPTLILSPSYCYAEGSGIPFTPRLVALNKNHAEMRSN
jgi:histo-blood group ABO system transferase